MWYLGILDRGLVPDRIIRQAIRRRCAERLRKQETGSAAERNERRRVFLEQLRNAPIAVHTDDANEQHYELPPEFFTTVLGRRLKYSCGLWPDAGTTLDRSEELMLELTVDRAGLASLPDGARVLDLGCGWGSLALYAAERFPTLQFHAVSNSRPQGEFIRERAREAGLSNLTVRTANIVDFEPEGKFDRIVSVEMFEHLKNYGEILRRIAGWLAPDGALFVHIFVHREHGYHYRSEGPDDWMARHFFTGGTMPSFDLFDEFADALRVAERWRVPGTHYQRTCEAWLRRMDEHRGRIDPILADAYGRDEVVRWRTRWRIFFMACAEMFGYRGGEEWFVAHYLLRPGTAGVVGEEPAPEDRRP